MKYILLASVLSLAAVTACQREDLSNPDCDGILNFSVSFCGSGEIVPTKGATLTSEDMAVSIPLSCIVTDGIEVELSGTAESESATKGTQINSEDEFLGEGLTSFTAEGWNADKSTFIQSQSVNYTDGKWQTSIFHQWKNSETKTFLAFANLPTSSATVTNYVTPSVKQTFTCTIPSDARKQNDIMLGWYEGNGGSASTAAITMVHPLTAVVFKKGEMEGITAIKSICIAGVFTSGVADVTYDFSGNDIVPTYNWGSTRTGSQNVTLSPAEGATELEVDDNGKIGTSFIILPQTIAEGALKLMITVVNGGEDVVLAATIPAGAWQEGKTNTYTIGCVPPTYNYTFTLEGGETSGSQDFRNTTYTGMDTITIVSEKENGTGTVSPAPWLIKSVQVGSEAAQTINASSFSGIGDLSAETTAYGNLKLTASERINLNEGGHEYWTGAHGDWSPDDWSTTNATALSPLDLSKFNFKNESINNPMTTANCYIIRHAGTYKIPLVYGNGVVDGNENTQSYFPDETGGTNRLERFLNHKGSGIQSAFIENNDGCKAAGSSIVWQDEAFVIKNLEIVGSEAVTYTKDNVRYLQFTVDPSTICQNNAVIAVKDEAGKIMWSWLIWTTNDPGLLGNPYKVSNTYGEYSFFQMNSIGWMDATEYPARDNVVITIEQPESGKTIEITVEQPIVSEPAHGNYYQFGRKDPMCRRDSPVSGGFFMDGVGKVDLQTAIMNPGTFISDAVNPGDWCSSTYDNLWTGKVSVQYEGSDPPYASLPAHTKTVYDPSPAGFKMPTKLALKFDGSTLLFPAQGYRHHTNVTIYHPDHSYYWSATPYNGGMYGNGTSVDVSPRSQGFSVRPILEKNPEE